jgi:hemoglobin
MRQSTLSMVVLSLAVAAAARAQAPAVPAPDPAKAAKPAPSPDEQVAGLEASCGASASERAARHAAKALFERLRGEEGIHAITREVVRLHRQNPAIQRFFDGKDDDKVAKRVAQFMISGTGGPKVYPGPDLTTSHRDMKLTNADFVSAGGDVMQAMKNLKYEPPEIDEVVCTLVSLRPLVVAPGAREARP